MEIRDPLSAAENIRFMRCRVESHPEPQGRPLSGTTAGKLKPIGYETTNPTALRMPFEWSAARRAQQIAAGGIEVDVVVLGAVTALAQKEPLAQKEQ